jgi:hypothetical protein
MADEVRKALSDLSGELERHEGARSEEGRELSETVRSAIEEDDQEGLGDRLTEAAVHFEVDHPDLAAVLRRTVQLMTDAGL